MTTLVHGQGFSITPGIRDCVARRFRSLLTRFGDRVERLDVYLVDLNGAARGGADKRARVRVRLRGQSPVVVETVADDVYAAIGLAASCCTRAVRRAILQARRFERTGLRDAAALGSMPPATSAD